MQTLGGPGRPRGDRGVVPGEEAQPEQSQLKWSAAARCRLLRVQPTFSCRPPSTAPLSTSSLPVFLLLLLSLGSCPAESRLAVRSQRPRWDGREVGGGG